MSLDLSLATARIRRVLSCASDQEIHDGLHFYEGAHGLCRLLARLGAPSPRHAAGVYAAISPLNTWEGNVSGCFSLVREGAAARLTTTHTNKAKALAILDGYDPETVLSRGPKVLAFFRAIADPSDRLPIPVDRHLARVAVGEHLDNADLSHLLANRDRYAEIEAAYRSVGEEEGIGNRVASVVWFVQRRVNGQAPD